MCLIELETISLINFHIIFVLMNCLIYIHVQVYLKVIPHSVAIAGFPSFVNCIPSVIKASLADKKCYKNYITQKKNDLHQVRIAMSFHSLKINTHS